MRQTFHIYQKMRKKIPHLLMPMTFPRLDAEKSSIFKTTQKFDFTWAEIAWVELKSNKLESLISSTCWRYNSMHFRKFWWQFAHAYQRHLRIFKNSWRIPKSNSQGVGPKFWYLQNQYNLLNQFLFFEMEKSLMEKSSVDF